MPPSEPPSKRDLHDDDPELEELARRLSHDFAHEDPDETGPWRSKT